MTDMISETILFVVIVGLATTIWILLLNSLEASKRLEALEKRVETLEQPLK